MKLKNIFLILFLCCTSLCFAQDKLFEKYADMDNVTSVFISKKMFDMIPNVESGGLNLMNLKGKILTTQNFDLPIESVLPMGTRGRYIMVNSKYIQDIRLQ